MQDLRLNVNAAWIVILLAAPLSGCRSDGPEPKLASPFPRTMVIAVAPVLNFSGDFSLDPVKAADLLASELADVQGITVLPVNRVMAVLAMQNRRQIESPEHALMVIEAVGADAIVVAGITEYDAYTPTAGVALQLYTLAARPLEKIDPVALSRQARPLALGDLNDPLQPKAQVQVVYNGMHKEVVDAVQQYAKTRSDPSNPLGWRQYLKVQSLYLRFCWHQAVERLMDQERIRQAVAAETEHLEVLP